MTSVTSRFENLPRETIDLLPWTSFSCFSTRFHIIEFPFHVSVLIPFVRNGDSLRSLRAEEASGRVTLQIAIDTD